jgi:CRP-like cAMP-binding protein
MINYSLLSNTILFRGIAPEEIASMLKCLGGKTKRFQKDSVIYPAGGFAKAMGVVLSGGVNIEQGDVWGNCAIIGNIGPYETFAETYACLQSEPMSVSVTAAVSTEVLFLEIRKMLDTCTSACPFHSRLIHNLLWAMAEKNLMLTRKMNHITSKSIRARLLSYLSGEAVRRGSYQFNIPFNRQQLADYLSVDRSALSNELSKCKRDGLLDFYKNSFKLKV